MQEIIEINSLSELHELAKELLDYITPGVPVAFYGSMGSGKTTLIKAICKELGVIDSTGSPTFSIVNEYLTKKGEKIFHFDFYRIKNETEVYDMGYEEYIYSKAYCFVEWPENTGNLLPDNTLKIRIQALREKRLITIITEE